ncbi:alpha/beta fold hydrolase [Clostridium sp. P21]|uniref:Alpha/beta fold hydrolase n=1 Tax=Clostridium muellerianum TaxID=2716538 RepID=A0A7Y0EKC8_9CLOT|nr:alpha/beta fold hydrolase [Clostridium muellerianum]NMM64030.1 alpha/beta fold hydrolase [Clostridium muellerianum]
MENKTELLKGKLLPFLSLNKTLEIVLVFILIAIIVLEGFSAYIVIKFSHPKSISLHPDIKGYGIKTYENVNFNSLSNNITLNGCLIKNGNSKKTIIICHGYGDSKFMSGGKTASSVKVDNLQLSKIFLSQGYNTLLFDFRGHGDYAGKDGVTIGFKEQQDLLGAVNFIKSKGIGDKIGVIGFSMGAATALSSIDKTNDISFVIADSPFSDLKTYLQSNMKIWTGLPDFPFVPMVLLNFKLIYGVDYSTVKPVSSVSKSKIPILLIHGKKDTTIPYTESLKIEKSFKNSKSKLVSFPDSTHIGSYSIYQNKYEEVLKDFLVSTEL